MNSRTLNFVSRHTPTPEQVALAGEAGYSLVHVGDVDAFDGDAVADLFVRCEGTAFAVVHPALALHLASLASDTPVTVGVFENANRAPEGERPQFVAQSLRLFTVAENTDVQEVNNG